MPYPDSLYPYDVMHQFVPTSVRQQLGEDLPIPLISSALLAEHRTQFRGPVLEITWPGTAILVGVLRAVKQTDAMLCVVVPPTIERAKRAMVCDAILDVAEVVHFERPLVIVGQVDEDPGDEERFLAALYAELEAGFTSIAIRPVDFAGDAHRIAARVRPLLQLGIGLELDFDKEEESALMLAQLDDAGVDIAAARGVNLFDGVEGALVIVDPLTDRIPADLPSRVSIDGFLIRTLERVLDEDDKSALLLDVQRHGARWALADRVLLFSRMSEPMRKRAEVFAYADTLEALGPLRAGGVARTLLEAILDDEEP